MQGIKESMK